jgi:hypothetical protein
MVNHDGKSGRAMHLTYSLTRSDVLAASLLQMRVWRK